MACTTHRYCPHTKLSEKILLVPVDRFGSDCFFGGCVAASAASSDVDELDDEVEPESSSAASPSGSTSGIGSDRSPKLNQAN